MTLSNKIYSTLTVILLIIFSFGMLKNLGNIAFWEDEGETVQLGKSILKFGYPSVFDGRSFILLDKNYHPQNYLRYTSPYLQFYVSAAAIFLFKNPADTFLMRLPFALSAITGAWISWLMFKKFGYSRFALFLYSLFLSTSIQIYLYWRQARHYALQFPLALGFLYSYLNLGKPKWNILFLVFGFLFYHAYYPGVDGLKSINPNLPKQPETLIATNFEDGAIYSYLDNQFLNSLAPEEKYRAGGRLPDWVIIRKNWGQEDYLPAPKENLSSTD